MEAVLGTVCTFLRLALRCTSVLISVLSHRFWHSGAALLLILDFPWACGEQRHSRFQLGFRLVAFS